MILDIDAGNTRLKWRLSANGSVVRFGIEDGSLQEMLNCLTAKIDFISIDRIRLVHVLGVESEAEFRVFLGKKTNRLIETAKSTAYCGEVKNKYKPPETLGVDRWLAILAAFQETKKKCCVIDCGSAITVDFVLGDGTYIGGYIAPGFKMLASTLAENTKQLPAIDFYKYSELSIGQSTKQAINNGILLMIVSFIEKNMANFFNNESDIKTVFLTGGDAEVIKEYLKVNVDLEVKFRPDLVIDGLSIALP